MKMSKGLIIAGVSVGVLLLLVMTMYGKFNGINKDGVKRETALSAQYQDNQNELSKFQSGFYEMLGVADAKSAQMDKILSDAVKGRYENGSSAAVPGAAGNTALFSAMVEAYPDLSGLDAFDKIIDYAAAGRESYKQQQSKLLDMLREYDTWRRSGLIHKQFVKVSGFPSSDLRAQIGAKAVTGEAALEQMRLIVTTSSTQEAYTTGTQEPMVIGKDK